MKAGVIGLGDMGSGLAKNLIENGFATTGFDLDAKRMAAFTELGGTPASSAAEVGANADIVFVMVMTGTQARTVILGDGLASAMAAGSIVALTATVTAEDARGIARELDGTGISLIDTPVSGGFPGAQSGTLTMMAAGDADSLERARPAMTAVSRSIHHVGDEPGMGQTVKACLQALIGSMFAATFEAAAMAAKAGVSGQVFHDVVQDSSAGNRVTATALENIIDRQFTQTGSHISTMHKDLVIALDLARSLGAPLFTTAAAMQWFQTAKIRHPEGDNWVVTRLIEDMIGAELSRAGKGGGQ